MGPGLCTSCPSQGPGESVLSQKGCRAGQRPGRAALQETLPLGWVGASPALSSLPSSSFYGHSVNMPKAGLTKPRLSSQDAVMCLSIGNLRLNQLYLVLSASLLFAPSNTPDISSKDYLEICHLWAHLEWPDFKIHYFKKLGKYQSIATM